MASYSRIHPVRPALMAAQCRQLAADLRREHAMGMGGIALSFTSGVTMGRLPKIPRDEAARSMDAQAERWEVECKTGIPNVVDRRKCE